MVQPQHRVLRGHRGERHDSLGGPRRGAIFVKKIKIGVSYEFAPIDPRLNGSETPENTDLFHIAYHWHYLQSLALGVDGVQASHQVLQEQLERLRKTEHRLPVDHEGCDLLSSILHDLAVVRGRIVR